MNMPTFRRITRTLRHLLFASILLSAGALLASEGGEAAAAAAAGDKVAETATAGARGGYAIYYAIALTMAAASASAAFAVGKIGAAVMGAAAEKPEILGKGIAFVGLGEGIALFGFLVSLFLIFKI